MLAAYDAQLAATTILYAITVVAMLAVWRRLAGVSLLPVVLASMATVALQMAADTLHDITPDFAKEDRIVSVSLHTAQLGLVMFVCMAEALYGHMASLPLGELEEPLFDKTEKEKAKEEGKRAKAAQQGRTPASRAQRTARAFRYVWPESRPLQLRLVACFVLVLAERCVNLAVPVLYKHMVDDLGSAAAAMADNTSGSSGGSSGGGVGGSGGSGGSWGWGWPGWGAGGARAGAVSEATRALLRAAAAAAGAGAAGAAEANGTLLAAAHGLLKAAQGVTFWSVFYPWVFAYLGFYFLRGGSGMEGLLANMRDLIWIPITQAAFRRISLDVFGHLLDLDHAFHLHRKTGQIMRILDRGTSSIQDTVSIVLFNVVPQLIDIVVACTYLAFKMQPWAAVIVFVTVASYVPLTVIITERRGVIRKRMNALDNAREGRATDMLLNYETVKYFCNEKFELAGYDNATRQYQAAEYWQMAFLAMLSITQASVVWLGLASGMVVCVRGVVRSSLTVGDAVLFVTMMNQLYVPLTFFGSYYRQVQKALIDMENMFELLDTAPSVQDPPGQPRRLVVAAGRVDFDQVVFGYNPTSVPVLKGVTFAVPGGKTLAVVGATGSGKSTILRLLLRFYDPQSGRVLIDSQDIRWITQESLRRAVAVVPQDTVMFNDTVLYNIRYGRTDATDAEVHEAASVAHIHNSIVSNFKKGYATRVGERGLRLSGGEKQRVAFARAVLKRPAVLILDEATSALDSLTELAIQSSLQTLRSRCTTVIVAHRLSTIMDADLILVLDRGEVAQCGSHSELMEEGGLYAAMWSRQQDTAGYTTPVLSAGGGHLTPAGGSGGVPGGAGAGGGGGGRASDPSGGAPPERHPPIIAATSSSSTGMSGGGALPGGGGGAVPYPRSAAAAAAGAYGLHLAHHSAPSHLHPHPHPHPQPSAAAAARLGLAVGGMGGNAASLISAGAAGGIAALGAAGAGAGGRPGALAGAGAVGGVGAGPGAGAGAPSTTGRMPRVPSRLMRRAFMSEEMSESGDHSVDISRNPTPRRARVLVEDEADEMLYEDREPEDREGGADTPAGAASPDRAKPGGGGSRAVSGGSGPPAARSAGSAGIDIENGGGGGGGGLNFGRGVLGGGGSPVLAPSIPELSAVVTAAAAAVAAQPQLAQPPSGNGPLPLSHGPVGYHRPAAVAPQPAAAEEAAPPLQARPQLERLGSDGDVDEADCRLVEAVAHPGAHSHAHSHSHSHSHPQLPGPPPASARTSSDGRAAGCSTPEAAAGLLSAPRATSGRGSPAGSRGSPAAKEDKGGGSPAKSSSPNTPGSPSPPPGPPSRDAFGSPLPPSVLPAGTRLASSTPLPPPQLPAGAALSPAPNSPVASSPSSFSAGGGGGGGIPGSSGGSFSSSARALLMSHEEQEKRLVLQRELFLREALGKAAIAASSSGSQGGRGSAGASPLHRGGPGSPAGLKQRGGGGGSGGSGDRDRGGCDSGASAPTTSSSGQQPVPLGAGDAGASPAGGRGAARSAAAAAAAALTTESVSSPKASDVGRPGYESPAGRRRSPDFSPVANLHLAPDD
ncbi:hypothetical protein HYH02_006243 [Chlamydomonas schloesseri]|uniref:Uncharacterized protein n=1 Tax=Chlamydomonas schloesseri TaxID=2026947 RepID=A0A836B6F4_9CHLO|nr:hypothetical protein HYH02_006243 [Chlamydomonas schloesseri]|eukprot:KAG2448895.1 hypothetical protein HYH02_006243 [Chlamydomonas schloesseri]